MMDPPPLAADRLRDPKATYDLDKGQLIRLSFTVSERGGCVLPFRGTDGVIQ